MNNWDRNNINYLMGLSEEEFDDFIASMSDDDVQYAIELIQLLKAENALMTEELHDVLYHEEGMDLSQAQAVLAKFRL